MPYETPRPAYGQIWTYEMAFSDPISKITQTLLLVCPVPELTGVGAWRVVRIDGVTGDPYEMYGLHAGNPINGYTYIEG